MSQLIARQLKKSFKQKTVVSDFSIHLNSGDIIGLLGPNGAGKTTSFYMIAGLIQPDAGCVYLDQKDLTACTLSERAQVGLNYLPQEASIFRKLSTYDNIMAILELQPQLNLTTRKLHCEQLLEKFNITAIRDELGFRLSGGERRRVEIARALATYPKFILLDEPFAGVDPISVEDIKKIIQDLAREGIGILITDHNVRETFSICDQATIMHSGTCLTQGAPRAILHDDRVRQIYLGDHFRL